MDAYEKTPSTFSRQQLETEALRLQSTADKIQDLYLELQTIDDEGEVETALAAAGRSAGGKPGRQAGKPLTAIQPASQKSSCSLGRSSSFLLPAAAERNSVKRPDTVMAAVL